MNLSNIVSGVIAVAEKLIPALEGTPAAAVVEAAQAVLSLIDEVKQTLTTEDPSQLQATRDELEPKVLAHLDSTINKLG